jgi:uncharacterized protein (TIGR02996 family)
MSDRQALLRSVVAAPDDDAPRLVFADWLDENGAPERAEFIRVQCRLAQSGVADPAYEALRDREAELWAAHGSEWAAPFARFGAELTFRRGFPDSARMSAEDFLRHGAELLRLSTVRAAELARAWLNADALAGCPALGALTALDLGRERPDARQFRALLGSRKLAGLRRLAVQAAPGEMPALAWAPHLAGLRALDLSRSRLGRRDWGALARSFYLRSLEDLCLRDTPLTDEGLIALAGADVLAPVTRLDLGGTDVGGDGVRALARAAKPAPLRVLRLGPAGGAPVRPADLFYLLTSPVTAGLRELGLRGVVLGDAGVKELAWAANLDGLVELDLGDTGLRPEGVRLLAGAPAARGLARLDLGGNEVGEDGMRHLAEGGLKDLRELSLAEALVGTGGVRALAGADFAPSLTVLDLRGNHHLGDDAAKVIAASAAFRELRELRLDRAPVGDAGALALAGSEYLGRLRLLGLRGCRFGAKARAALLDRFGARAEV